MSWGRSLARPLGAGLLLCAAAIVAAHSGLAAGMVGRMKTYRGFFGRVPMMQHTLAELVHWRAEFSTGDSAIDIQDRAIFNLVGEIDKVWRHGAGVAQVRRPRRPGGAACWRRTSFARSACSPRSAIRTARSTPPSIASCWRIWRRSAATSSDDGAHAGRAGLQLCNFILGVVLGHMVNTDSDYCAYLADETGRISTGSA